MKASVTVDDINVKYDVVYTAWRQLLSPKKKDINDIKRRSRSRTQQTIEARRQTKLYIHVYV